MSSYDPVSDLTLLVRSRYSLIQVAGSEERRIEELVARLAAGMSLPLFTWTISKGLRREGMPNTIYDTARPAMALAHVEASPIPAIYHFVGLEAHLADPGTAARFRDVARKFGGHQGAVILSGDDSELPEGVRNLAMRFELPAPDAAEYRALLDRIVCDLSARMTVRVSLSESDTARLIANLNGLTLLDTERILTRAILEDGCLSAGDLEVVVRAKRELVERDGLLEYFAPEQGMSEIIGVDGLKSWLAKRHLILTEPERAREFGLAFPRGILLLGIPGCGKSRCAKAVASEWALPLIRLDVGALYDKYIGETEKNFRRALSTAERYAPVVLWIDEIEKAFAPTGGDQDGGVSTRVLGGFLSWMQERTGNVFLVATANDIERLPPELLRKGRFDEIFFVDLPTAESRREIFRLHLAKRGRDATLFDLDTLAAMSNGFSGAEIEQAVVSALYSAFSARTELATAALCEELSRTRPLSRIMGERMDALRAWARDRTIPAA
jgi:AAA+ superfamily predicted ATPase